MQEQDLYASEYPDNAQVVVDDDIKDFFRRYYATTDTCGKHEEYAQLFARDAVFVYNETRVNADGLQSAHRGSWELYSNRVHRPIKVFPFGDRAMEFIVLGTVEYWGNPKREEGDGDDNDDDDRGKHGKQSFDMAAHFQLQRSPSGAVEIKSLRVWLSRNLV